MSHADSFLSLTAAAFLHYVEKPRCSVEITLLFLILGYIRD